MLRVLVFCNADLPSNAEASTADSVAVPEPMTVALLTVPLTLMALTLAVLKTAV
jgi:hypothetical protein